MARTCCHKQNDAEECVILISVDTPAPHNLGFYQSLRFGLLASSWLPSSVGIFLWSALHVMLLIVGGPALWVFRLLVAFLFCSVLLFGYLGIALTSFFMVYGVLAMSIDLVLLVVESIRFSWSLVGFLASHEPMVEWRGGARWTEQFWKDFEGVMMGLFWEFVPFGVPSMSGSLYEDTKDAQFETWALWCEEVVRMHKAIAL